MHVVPVLKQVEGGLENTNVGLARDEPRASKHGERGTSMPMRTRDRNPRSRIRARRSGVAIEKRVFSMVARCRGPREASWRESSVFPRAKDMRRGSRVVI